MADSQQHHLEAKLHITKMHSESEEFDYEVSRGKKFAKIRQIAPVHPPSKPIAAFAAFAAFAELAVRSLTSAVINRDFVIFRLSFARDWRPIAGD